MSTSFFARVNKLLDEMTDEQLCIKLHEAGFDVILRQYPEQENPWNREDAVDLTSAHD